MNRAAKIKMRRKAIEAVGILLGLIVILTGMVIASGGTDAEPAPPTLHTTSQALQIATLSMVDYETVAEATGQPDTKYIPAEADIEMLAKLIWGEARGVKSTTEKAAVVWCVLNRVDSTDYACGESIEHVITFPGQFTGYSPEYPATEEHKRIAEDVLARWYAEKVCTADSGRVLPREYTYFTGDGKHNYFTDEWKGGNEWDWSLPSPYDN